MSSPPSSRRANRSQSPASPSSSRSIGRPAWVAIRDGRGYPYQGVKKARITPVKAFKDAVLAPAKAPKLKKGAFPTDDSAVAVAGKSTAPVAARVPARRAPAKKTAAKKAPAKRATATRRRRRSGHPPGRPPRGSSLPEPLAERPLAEPHPDRLSPAEPDFDDIVAAHASRARPWGRHLCRSPFRTDGPHRRLPGAARLLLQLRLPALPLSRVSRPGRADGAPRMLAGVLGAQGTNTT